MKYRETFIQSVNLARLANLELQSYAINRGIHHSLGVDAFAIEYKTVNINIGRMVGKTTYIIDNVGPTDLVICRNQATARHIDQSTRNICEVWTIDQIDRKLIGDSFSFRDVYIDEPGITFLRSETFGYFLRKVFVNNQIIMLGTSVY